MQGVSGGVPALVAGQIENCEAFIEGLDPAQSYILWAVNGCGLSVTFMHLSPVL